MSTHDDLQRIALAEFASAGYIGTSLQRIAELAGLSKSSVLYHYASKEALLAAALTPAVDAMAEILGRTNAAVQSADSRETFIEDFVDCLLQYRLEIHVFINQSRALIDVPIMDRANAIVQNIADYFTEQDLTLEQKMRFGIALGGAAYALASGEQPAVESADELKTVLTTILSELLASVPTTPSE